MALFNAPAWMIKGGSGGGGTTIGGMSDSDPYKKGKTKVKFRVNDNRAKLDITNNKTKFILSFIVTQIGFTDNAANVQYRIELKAGGHWRYTGVLGTANLTAVGMKTQIDISNQINRSGQVKLLLTDPSNHNVDSHGKGKCYLLFETNTEICDDQIRCDIEIK